jgi:hypothetical protein
LDISELSKPWYDEWIKRTATAASQEATRRYYSVKKLLFNHLRNNMYYQCDPTIEDKRFFDLNPLAKWALEFSIFLDICMVVYTTIL